MVLECIDRLSKKLIWLKVTKSTKVPEVISKYCLKALKRLKGVSKTIRSGDSTKYSLIEPVHTYQRSLNDDKDDSLHSFSVVSYPVNHRIEYYWSKCCGRPG